MSDMDGKSEPSRSTSDDQTPLESRRSSWPTLEQGFPGLAESHRYSRDVTQRELAYFVERRDKLTERMLFGVLTLNGASLLALLSAMGGKGEAAVWLGFTRGTAQFSAAAFTIGLILSAIAINLQQNGYVNEAGDAATRAGTFSRIAMRYKEASTVASVDALGEELKAIEELPLTGFQYSTFGITLQNFSGSVWLAGILAPLIASLFGG